MEFIPYLIIVLILIFWRIDSFLKDRRSHQERMELLKMVKADSLNEFLAGEHIKTPKVNNYLQHEMKDYTKMYDGD